MTQPPAAVVGLTLGVGLWLLVSLIPRVGRPRLVSRLAPYVVDISDAARDLVDHRTADPLPVFGLLLEPVFGRLRRLISTLSGGDDGLARLLKQAGSPLSVDAFRSRQLTWALAGAAAGVVVAFATLDIEVVPVAAKAGVVAIGAAAGFFARGYLLRRAAAARVARMAKQLPTILEFLTLSLSAGEGILDALRRVSRISSADIAVEFGRVVSAVATGLPLIDCLNRLASDLEFPDLSRAVDQITGALDRGTPLAEVLRAQAQDSREQAKRELIESAGAKEVAMLVPLVFLILPITIVIAVFPGVFVLQAGF